MALPAPKVTFPPWLMPVLRFIFALVIIYIGLKGWADGYGGLLIVIGSGLVVAELSGAGLSRAQAREVAGYIAELEAKLAGVPPPDPTPVESSPPAPWPARGEAREAEAPDHHPRV